MFVEVLVPVLAMTMINSGDCRRHAVPTPGRAACIRNLEQRQPPGSQRGAPVRRVVDGTLLPGRLDALHALGQRLRRPLHPLPRGGREAREEPELLLRNPS